MNDRFKQALDELAGDLFQFFCDPILEADIVAHLYHIWFKISATQIGWPHVSVRLPGLRPRETVDFAVGSVSQVHGRKWLDPLLVVEVKALLKDFRPQAISTHVDQISKRDLPKLARIHGAAADPEKYLLIADEYGYFLQDPRTGGKEKMHGLLLSRERLAPSVTIILFEKRDTLTRWLSYRPAAGSDTSIIVPVNKNGVI